MMDWNKIFSVLWLASVAIAIAGLAVHLVVYVWFVSPGVGWGQAFDRVFWYWTPAVLIAGLCVVGMMFSQLFRKPGK